MEVVSVPEASLVALNVTNLAPLIFEVRLPHQRPVPENPQAGLPGDDILRLHCFWIVSFDDVQMNEWIFFPE